MSDYVPTVEEVKRQWGIAVDYHRRPERLAQFDRMIADVKAEAWEEGVAYVNVPFGIEPGMRNPYRKGQNNE